MGNKPKTMEGGGESFMMIDGKEVPYTSRRVQFTPDGQHVVCDIRAGDTGPKNTLLVDGKPMLTAGFSIDQWTISPSGDVAAVASETGGNKQMYLNGKPVEGTQNVMDVKFSPDGKHWAARCASSPQWWVVVDGKKQQDYRMVSGVAFTSDSSKCVYIAEAGGKKFVVINGEEDAGNPILSAPPTFGKTGNHVTYATSDRTDVKVIRDGKAALTGRMVSQLTVSPDGSRVAYYLDAPGFRKQLVVDDEVKSSAPNYMNTGSILFSPDSKHIVAPSWNEKGSPVSFVDGALVPPFDGASDTQFLTFTPDSKHLLVASRENSRTGPFAMTNYYVDGQRVAQLREPNFASNAWPNAASPSQITLWEPQPDGTIVVIGPSMKDQSAGDPNKFGPMVRIKITPSSESSVASWAANVAAADAKAKADAAQAEADKQAAQDKARADAQKARDDAAKARADAAKARADAAAKARADAAAAKAKAKADADAARKQRGGR